MPLHDWTRVGAYAYHDFHTAWLVAIRNALNRGVLPAGYYARAEQTTRTMGPDVLTLQARPPAGGPTGPTPPSPGRLTATVAPPRVRVTEASRPRSLAFQQKRLAIRHASGDELIAILEIVSPGNKSGRSALKTFVRKVARAVEAGIHAVVIDPFPPGRSDPHGIHAAIWPELGGGAFTPPADKPLTLAAYQAGDAGGSPHRCYVEPIAVGDVLPDVPLFLEADAYVNVPVEASYQAAWADVLPQDSAAMGG